MNMRRNKTLDLNYTWKKTGKLLTLLLILFFLTACQKTKVSTTPNIGIIDIQVTNVPMSLPTTMEPYIFRTSQPGTATLHGILVVLDPSMAPAHDDAIYLVPIDQDSPGVSAIPQFTKGEVPQADVDERTGEFMFTDIKAGRYVVVVVTMGGAQIPVRTMDESRNLVVVKVDETFPDKITEIGTMSLP
jgi:hypothetical protein